jgi:hypothetical protein
MAPFRVAWGPHAADQLLDHDYERSWLRFRRKGSRPLWDAWGHAAEQLLRCAADDLAMARATLEHIRRAVIAQFYEACWMLQRRVAS